MNYNNYPRRPPQQRPRAAPNQQQLARLPDPAEMGTLIVRNVSSFARRNKPLTAFYLIGWLVLAWVAWHGGTPMTMEQRQEYGRILNTINVDVEYQATQEYWQTRQVYHASRGWFWSCDALCQRHKQRFQRAEQVLNEIRAETAARMSDAKKVAGVLSQTATDEVQDSFWQYFYQGKQFAKRQSMWDAMFLGLRSMTRGRDESWIEYGLKVLMQVLMNFTMGLCMSLLFFVLGLWGIVRSYQPNPIVAVLVFVGAAAAAFSYVMTYLVAIYGAAAGGVYGVLKVAESTARAQIAQQQQQARMQQQPYNNNYNNRRPHYD